MVFIKFIYSTILVSAFLFIQGCGGGTSSTADTPSQHTNQSPNNNNTNPGDNKTTKPHITLNGEKTILLHSGSTFTDPGATAADSSGNDISSKITHTGTVKTSVPGTYEILYSVTDSNGNTDTAKRKVIVLDIIQNPETRKPSGIVLNELLAMNNTSEIDPDFKQFSDYIELYNHSGSSINIGNYYLSDDSQNLKKWKLPTGTSLGAGEHLLVWADKKDTNAKALHTNFSLSGDGETVTLSDASGNVVDQITFKKQKRDIAVTKIGDSNYFMKPTPEKPNTQATNALVKSEKPTFSSESGFYNGSVNIELSQENGGKIYYTTDGSIPTKSSSVYSQPIPVTTTMVIRARALENDKFLSSTVNHTFLIDEKVSLPVVSIAINDEYFKDLYNVQRDSKGNYIHPWFRPAGIEYFKEGKVQFSNNVGIKTHGNFSSAYAHKSLAIYTKNKYGTKSINYPLFEQKPHIQKIKSFILRNSGNDWKQTMIRDGLFHTLVKDQMDIDYCAYQPTVVFVNGEYRGILNIREKANENYLAANHQVNKKEIDLLENYHNVMAGDDKTYMAMLEYIQDHDLDNETYYDHIASQIDIDEYMNYMITEIYVGNSDWLGKNIRFWREKKAGAKWRWILQDLDFGFGRSESHPVTFNALQRATAPGWRTIILTGLLQNQNFKNRFISKFITHLNSTFRPERVIRMINTFADRIEDEMPSDIARWKDSERSLKSMNDWDENIKKLTSYASQRDKIVIEHIKEKFQLSGAPHLHIDTQEANGTIYVDGVKIDNSFDADYFNGIQVTLKAVPAKEHRFVRWSNGLTSPEITVVLNSDINLQAVFEAR